MGFSLDDEYHIEFNSKRIKEQYFIDPYGKIHKYRGNINDEIVSIHSEIAHSIYPDHNKPQDTLNHLGWITIGSTVYCLPIIYIKPTQAQINKLTDLGLYESLLILDGNSFIYYNETKNNK